MICLGHNFYHISTLYAYAPYGLTVPGFTHEVIMNINCSMRVLYSTRVYIDSIRPSHMTLPLGNYIHSMAIGEVFSLFRVVKVQALSLDDSVDENTASPRRISFA